MNRLNDIDRNGGFPLVAESVEILNENMQILESVIKGMDIPNNYVIRFRDSDYAYYDGKILKITVGNDLPNSTTGERREARVFTNNYDVVDSNGTHYHNSYIEEELRLFSKSISDSAPLPPTKVVRIYDFSELIDKSLWKQCDFLSSKQDGSDVSITGDIHQVMYNDRELRIRTVFTVNSLPTAYELQLKYDCDALDGRSDVITLMATFNGNSNNVNHYIPAYLVDTNDGILIKIVIQELVSMGIVNNGDVFTGQITLNGIVVL